MAQTVAASKCLSRWKRCFTEIRVIRDDYKYNKLLQFLIYIFYRSLTKFLKHTERYPIGEKIRPAIPREVLGVLDIPTLHIKVHAPLLL